MTTTTSNAVRGTRGTATPADGATPSEPIAVREPALHAAALTEGFDPEGAVLLSEGGRSRVYRMPAATWKGRNGVVAKVHPRGHTMAAAQLCAVAYWVRSQGVHTPRPLRREPITSRGLAVSFWEDFGAAGPAAPEGLAGVLSDLHSLPEPPAFLGLRAYNPFTDLHVRVRQLTDQDPTVRGHLLHELQNLARWLNETRWPTRAGVIHTALSPRETMATDFGAGILDLADLRIGPPMVDLASVALQHQVYAEDPAVPQDQEDDEDPAAVYKAFHEAYGVDVTRFAAGRPYRALRWIHVLTGCIDALERSVHSSAWAIEGEYRLSCVRGEEGDPPWCWQTAAEMAEAER